MGNAFSESRRSFSRVRWMQRDSHRHRFFGLRIVSRVMPNAFALATKSVACFFTASIAACTRSRPAASLSPRISWSNGGCIASIARTAAAMSSVVCSACGRHYPIEDGIPNMLVDDDA